MSGHHAAGQPKTRKGESPGWRAAITPARILALALAALALILIIENTRQIRIRLLIPVVSLPLYAALLIMFAIGLLSGALLMYNRSRHKSDRTRAPQA